MDTEQPRELCWVYGILREGHPIAPDMTGVPGSGPVEAISEGGLAAAVSRGAPDTMPSDEVLMDDNERLRTVLLAHDAVQRALVEDGDVLPTRFATVCTETDARSLLSAHRPTLDSAFAQVGSQREWGVQMFVGAGSAHHSAPRQRRDAPGAGRAYLAGRQEQARQRGTRHERGKRSSEDLHGRLASVATAGVRIGLHAQHVTGRTDEMVYNASFLVAREAEDRFKAIVTRAGGADITCVLTGPWPPHHFVDLDLSGDANVHA